MKKLVLLITTLCFLLGGISRLGAQDEVTYGFVQDPSDPLYITAVAYPNFTSNNVTISTAVFSFLLPEGTVTTPAVPVAPATGTFNDSTGVWLVQKITPTLYGNSGGNPADLQGNDVYQVTLQNSPMITTANGVYIPLFGFRLPSDCMGGNVEVLTNDGAIQQAIFNLFFANFNNQMSMSIDDAPTTDIYAGNDPSTFSYPCPLDFGPDAQDDTETIAEDSPTTNILVLANDDFGGNGPSTSAIYIASGAGNGAAVVDDNGTPNDPTDDTIDYTPNGNFNGTDMFTYAICDIDGDCDTATVTINVTAVNDQPVAQDDTDTVDEDDSVTTDVVANDSDPNDPGGGMDPTSVDIVTPPANGTVSVDPVTGEITYTPDPDFNGIDTYEYEICDTGNPLPPLCDTATVTITVNPVNDPPLAVDDSDMTDEETPVTTDVVANDSDPSDPAGGIDPTSVAVVTQPANGTLSVDPVTGAITYTPDMDFVGTDTYEYEVCDTGNPLPPLCDTATVTITVGNLNDQPVAQDDTDTVDEDDSVTTDVVANDSDPNDPGGTMDPTSVDIVTPPSNGTVSVDPVTGEITYTPDPDFNGTDSYEYEVCDTGNPAPPLCDTATVTITVNPVNDPPLAVDDSDMTDEETPVTTDVVANDSDPSDPAGGIDPTSVAVVTQPANGTLSVDPVTGAITYTPDMDFVGTDTYEYEVCDTGNPLPPLCDTATVTITVGNLNDQPVAQDDTDTVDEDDSVTTDVVANDSDPNDPGGTMDPTSVDIVTPPSNGTVSVDPVTGEITYTPDPDFNGTDSYEYEVCDTGNPAPPLCDTATVTITVNPVNDPPVALDDSDTTDENVPVTTDVVANDDDPNDPAGDIDPTSVTIVTQPTNGTLSVDPVTGEITYTPDPYFYGSDSYEYAVCDTGNPLPAACDTATVALSVNAIYVRLNPQVLLQGALLSGSGSTMSDSLRANSFIPLQEPYGGYAGFNHVLGGGETITSPGTVLSDKGNNSVTDWVFIELRDPNDSTVVVATRSALVERDGDVVDIDGMGPVLFGQTLSNAYYVSIRHRNHIGVMTKTPIVLSATGTTVDFRNTATDFYERLAAYDGYEQATVNGSFALWAGNTNADDGVVFAGQDNDKDPIFNEVDGAPGNILKLQTYVYHGYHFGDVNMDGSSIFAGQDNDVDPIFNNVDGHPANVLKLQTFIIQEQLPQ